MCRDSFLCAITYFDTLPAFEVENDSLLSVMTHSVCVCLESWYVCHDSFCVCLEYLYVCHDSFQVCHDSFCVCHDSFCVCLDSFCVCHDFLSFFSFYDSFLCVIYIGRFHTHTYTRTKKHTRTHAHTHTRTHKYTHAHSRLALIKLLFA